MAPIVPTGSVVWGLQLPVQSQSRLYVEDWELRGGPPDIVSVAQAADRCGAFYVAVCDHVAIPDELAGRMGTVWYDAIATLAWLAAQTRNTRLLSSVWNVNYRHPLVTAKAFATLDLLSQGRVVIGVGAGHVEREFAALGVPFNGRGALTDEALRLLDRALTAGAVELPEAGLMHVEPRAVQQSRPPIWVGGSGRPAVRRAARYADGWLPQATPLREMTDLVAFFRDERQDSGGDIGAIPGWVHVGDPTWNLDRPALSGSPDRVAAGLRRWVAAGVNHLQVRFPSRDAAELIDQIEQFAATVAPLLSD